MVQLEVNVNEFEFTESENYMEEFAFKRRQTATFVSIPIEFTGWFCITAIRRTDGILIIYDAQNE